MLLLEFFFLFVGIYLLHIFTSEIDWNSIEANLHEYLKDILNHLWNWMLHEAQQKNQKSNVKI